jgi:hypothetical protein
MRADLRVNLTRKNSYGRPETENRERTHAHETDNSWNNLEETAL